MFTDRVVSFILNYGVVIALNLLQFILPQVIVQHMFSETTIPIITENKVICVIIAIPLVLLQLWVRFTIEDWFRRKIDDWIKRKVHYNLTPDELDDYKSKIDSCRAKITEKFEVLELLMEKELISEWEYATQAKELSDIWRELDMIEQQLRA